MELRKILSKLESLITKIGNSSLRLDLTQLIDFANECVHSFMYSFNVDGNAILEENERLRKIKCPSRVEVERLYQTLQRFKSSIQISNDETVKLRSMTHDVFMNFKEEESRNEKEISFKQLDIAQCEDQIKNVESTIEACEKRAIDMEVGARELERRAKSLRKRSARHRENGFLWTLASTTVGIVFTPFTAGASLVAGLTSAGIGLKVNFDSASDCCRKATRLRDGASVERRKVEDQHRRKCELLTEKQNIYSEIYTYERAIKELSEANGALVELEKYLLSSIKCTEDATFIVLDLEKALKKTELQGDTVVILQQLFVEEPTGDFYDDTYAEIDTLKKRWKELTNMILIFSGSRGVQASFDMESGSPEQESQDFKRNLLFELYYAQKEAARFLELAYLALKDDPNLARKVRKSADDAQNQHIRTHGLMEDYQETAKHVVEEMIPFLKKGLEKKNVDFIKIILEKVLVYVNKMIEKTKDTQDRYFALKGEVQDRISDIVAKNKKKITMKTDINLEEKKLKASLLASKKQYDDLQVKTEELAEEIKKLKKKRYDLLDNSIQTDDCNNIESAIDGIFIPGASVTAGAYGCPVLGGAVLIGGLFASHCRRSQRSKQTVIASDKVRNDLKKSEHTLDGAEKRMFKIIQESIEKITILRKLALQQAEEIDQASLEKAYTELGQVGEQFSKIVFLWKNFAVKLETLIKKQDSVEVLLKVIHEEDFKVDLDRATNDITEVWSSFQMICAYYVNKSKGEIRDLYSFLSDPVDQLSIEDCQRRKEQVLAKMEAELKAFRL